jgi:hypothetical protein
MAPPSMRRWRVAALIKSRLPASNDPPAHPNPLLKATATRSNGAASSASFRPLATAAFHKRAPSRKLPIPRALAASQTACTSACGKDEPTAAVVGVLDLHERRRREHRQAARLDRCFELRCGEEPPSPTFDQLDAGIGRGATGFVPTGVRLPTGHDFVARPGHDAQRHLVAIVPLGSHSAAGLPSNSAQRSWSWLVSRSSPYWSSPTGAAAIAARISGVGR